MAIARKRREQHSPGSIRLIRRRSHEIPAKVFAIALPIVSWRLDARFLWASDGSAPGSNPCSSPPLPLIRTTTLTMERATPRIAACARRLIKPTRWPGTVTIKFNIGGGGPRTIKPLFPLPAITVPVVIDGSSQPFFNGTSPLIELDGSTTGGGGPLDGLVISGGNSTVKSLAIINFSGRGILIRLSRSQYHRRLLYRNQYVWRGGRQSSSGNRRGQRQQHDRRDGLRGPQRDLRQPRATA